MGRRSTIGQGEAGAEAQPRARKSGGAAGRPTRATGDSEWNRSVAAICTLGPLQRLPRWWRQKLPCVRTTVVMPADFGMVYFLDRSNIVKRCAAAESQ